MVGGFGGGRGEGERCEVVEASCGGVAVGGQ